MLALSPPPDMPKYTEPSLFAYALAVPLVLWYGASDIQGYRAMLGAGEPSSWIVSVLVALYVVLALYVGARIVRAGTRNTFETQVLLAFGLLVTIAGALAGAIAFIGEHGAYAVVPIWNAVYAFVLAKRFVDGDVTPDLVGHQRVTHRELVLYGVATMIVYLLLAYVFLASPAMLTGLLVALAPPVGELLARTYDLVRSN